MRKLLIFLVVFPIVTGISAQTNTFPTSGNAGIGTTMPNTKLHIANTTDVPTQMTFSNSMQEWRIGVHNGYAESFNLYNATLGTTNFIVTTGGNVGIGTTAPNTKLHLANTSDIPTQISFSNSMQEWRMSVHNGYSESFNLYNATSGTTDFIVTTLGNIGIGTTSPTEKLSVNGNIRTKKVIVTRTNWSDYVFDEAYKLKPLAEVAQFIKQNKHLPEIPSAKEVMEKGVDLGDNQALLLKKIEELTLYLIEMKNNEQQLQKRVSELENLLNKKQTTMKNNKRNAQRR